MENKNGSKWQPVTTQWREGQYEAIGANGAKVIIVKGQQFDRIAKAGGKNPLCRLIDSFQVYYEMQKRIQELQEQVTELTQQVEEANKKAKKSFAYECEARRDMVILKSRLNDRDRLLSDLRHLGVINEFNDIMITQVRDKDYKLLYYKKK
jgi:hypothetical protein